MSETYRCAASNCVFEILAAGGTRCLKYSSGMPAALQPDPTGPSSLICELCSRHSTPRLVQRGRSPVDPGRGSCGATAARPGAYGVARFDAGAAKSEAARDVAWWELASVLGKLRPDNIVNTYKQHGVRLRRQCDRVLAAAAADAGQERLRRSILAFVSGQRSGDVRPERLRRIKRASGGLAGTKASFADPTDEAQGCFAST